MVQAHSRYNLNVIGSSVDSVDDWRLAGGRVAGGLSPAACCVHCAKPGSIDEIASGDLRRSITVQSSNEIGQLFPGLQKMQVSQRQTIEQISQYAHQLASARRAVETGDGGK